MMCLPFYLFILSVPHIYTTSVQKEEIIPVSSPIQLKCENDLRVGNIDVTIRQINLTCLTTTVGCTLPTHAIAIINETCNNEVVCYVDIRNITNSITCLQHNGYYNVWYTCKTVTEFSCNFDSGLCSWTPVHVRLRYRWTYGFRIDDRFPVVDHTSASTTGKYAYIYARSSREDDIASLEIEHIIPTDQQCLSFWFFKTNSRDSVYVLQNDTQLLDLSSYDGKQWHHLHVPLHKTSVNLYKLAFKVIRGNSRGSFGAIAIDDILIENQKCDTYLLKCDFDTTECYWENNNSNQYKWEKQKGEDNFYWPETDHSTASESGYYMHLNSYTYEYITKETTASFELENVDVNIYVNSCLTFWYYFNIYGEFGLNVTLDNELVWTTIADQNDKWKKAKIDLHNIILDTIKFIGIIRSGWTGDIAIDDIYIKEGACKGSFDHEEICEKISKETVCPRGYFDFTKPHLSFDPEKEECHNTYNQTKFRILQECRHRNDSEKCLIDLSTDIRSHPECFQVYEYRILYTCEDEIYTTVSSDITSKGDSSSEDTLTTVGSDLTSKTDFKAGDDTTVTTISSVINAREDNSSDDTTVYAVVVSTLVIIIVVALVFIVIVCHLKKRTKSSKLCDVRPITTVTETIDSSGYNIINYNNMTGICIHEKDNNRHEINATNCQPEDIRTAIKQEDTIGNKYESLSTNRNPSEHAYELDPIHTNRYQTLTKQRESDKHFYESTEPAQAHAQDNNTLTGQEDDNCHKYEFLSTNRNSVEHAYELDLLHTNQYVSLTKQREYDKHTYESTEPAQKQDIKTLTGQEDDNCHKYESLSTNRNSAEHTYESDSIHNNQYESLTNQQESNEHTNQSNGYELPVSMKQEQSQYQSLTTPQRGDRHVYASTGSLK